MELEKVVLVLLYTQELIEIILYWLLVEMRASDQIVLEEQMGCDLLSYASRQEVRLLDSLEIYRSLVIEVVDLEGGFTGHHKGWL